jgi:serine O-acetyltransferase
MTGRQVLAHYLQSQASTNFQIDIHPNATLGSGIMVSMKHLWGAFCIKLCVTEALLTCSRIPFSLQLDHGTGIVIGETATVGHNCSILHHVTLGGSGRRGNDRHPKIGSGSSRLVKLALGAVCRV